MAAALNLSRNHDHFNGSYNSKITLSLRIMEYSIADRISDITPKRMTGSDQSTSTQTPWKLEGELGGRILRERKVSCPVDTPCMTPGL